MNNIQYTLMTFCLIWIDCRLYKQLFGRYETSNEPAKLLTTDKVP